MARTSPLPSRCLLCGNETGTRDASGWRCTVCEWRVGDVPDADLPPPRVDVVYYLRNGDRVKIGTTGKPKQRFTAIWHEEIVAFERGDRTLERVRHEQFAADRFPGSEWFHLSSPLRKHLRALSRGVKDPWHSYARWMSEALRGVDPR